jgi:adenylosuccinate synthase
MRHTPSHLVLDLGFGDAGKGTTVDWLAAQSAAPLVVRAHGGGQAGHRVVVPDGRAHVFAQFGAGLFHPGARSLLGPEMVVDPIAWRIKCDHLRAAGVRDAAARSAVSRACRITTSLHRAVGQLRELARGRARHGSCGTGFGETVREDLAGARLRAGDLDRGPAVRRWLAEHAERMRVEAARLWACLPNVTREDAAARAARALLDDPGWADETAAWFRDWCDRVERVDDDGARALVARCDAVIYEGAQGVLLDEVYGLRPHTTWSDCTPGSAERLHRVLCPGAAPPLRWGVTRTYATRHGAGPLPSEDATLRESDAEAANGDGPWQGPFRCGWADAVLLRTARAIVGPLDGVVVTHCDRVPAEGWPLVTAWHARGATFDRLPAADPTADWDAPDERTALATEAECIRGAPCDASALLEAIAEAAGAPLALTSWGATRTSKRSTDAMTL